MRTPVADRHYQCRRGARGGLRLFLVTLLLLCPPSASHCWAQFSGPAPGPAPAENLRPRITTDPAILYPGEREIELLPGDQLSIHIFEATDYLPIVRISIDGSVQLPLIGNVVLSGLTIHQGEALIARRLIDAGMYRNPQVTIQVTESPNQIITVTGEAHGVIPALGGNRRLYDVIAAAGGFPSTASHVVTINRPGVPEPITIDLGADPAHSNAGNIPVFARDTVVISRIGVVYILGAFKNQGAIPIQSSAPLTLLEATALGGGAGFEGKYNDLRIIRTVGLERKVIRVDISEIYKGKAPDPILESNDIVFLPSSDFKAAIKAGGLGILLGVISVLVVAGNSL